METSEEILAYFKNVKWQEELALLRCICLNNELDEEYKWRNPCYTQDGKNILLLGFTKNYCMISFFKGVLLSDPKKILTAQTKNMQSDRQIRFSNLDQIIKQEKTIHAYIQEAITIEKSGKKVQFKKTAEYDVPTELQETFEQDAQLKKAFQALTPGRQRGYLLHFAGAKKAETRISRIHQNKKRIMMKKGLNDCICGQSKRMPNCDGSHKYIK